MFGKFPVDIKREILNINRTEQINSMSLREIGNLRLLCKEIKNHLDSEPFKSFIKNKKRTTYQEIQKMIDDKGTDDDFRG